MGFVVERILLLITATLMFMPQMKNLDGASSSVSFSAIVVAFDVALLSNALKSFGTRGGEKDDSFDLVICISKSRFADESLEQVVMQNALEFYTRFSNCSEITPPSPSDYRQVLYMIIPESKSEVGEAVEKISKVYHVIKRRFHSTRVPKLLWMPLFLVIWPDFEDYCQDEATSQRLFQSYITQTIDNHSVNVADDGERRSISVYKSFSVNSDVYIYFGSGCDGLEDNILEVYSLSSGMINVQKLTPDNRKYESMFEGILGRVRRRMNLHNSSIRAINSRDPSSFLEAPRKGVLDPLEIFNGTPRVVFSELKQSLNFSEHIITGDWISRYKNGTLKGRTVKYFRRGLADITISLTSLLPYRKVELSFLQPTYANSVNGFFVQPAASTLRDIAIKPFSTNLWITLFITFLILILSIVCFGKVYARMYVQKDVPLLSDNDSSFRDESVLWAVAAITQQGWHISPTSNPMRIVFTVGYYLGLVCYGAFSAAIVSILAVELVPIKTRSDLLNSDLKFYADNASSTMAYIVDYLRQHTKVKFGNRVNIEEGVAKLQSRHPSCYIAFPQYFYLSALNINISEKWICNHLSVVPVTTVATPSSMVVPRNSQYSELFNFMILKMRTRGLNSRFVHLYNEVTSAKCSKESGTIFYPLGIKDVFTAGLILFAGMLFAMALLLLERAFKILNCIHVRMGTSNASSSNNNRGFILQETRERW